MFNQPALIPAGATRNLIETQLTSIQLAVAKDELPPSNRLDEMWALQAEADIDTRYGCLFLLNLLVVPHSSASCERVFSYVRKIKTDQRQLMGDELLDSLIVLKHIPGSPIDRTHSTETLR